MKNKLFEKVIKDVESVSDAGSHSSHVESYKNILTKQLLNLDRELIQASKEISDISGTYLQ